MFAKDPFQKTVCDITDAKVWVSTLNPDDCYSGDSNGIQQAGVALADPYNFPTDANASNGRIIWVVDANDYSLMTFNNAFKDFCARESNCECRVGLNLDEILPPISAAQWHERFDRVLRAGAFDEEDRASNYNWRIELCPLAGGEDAAGIAILGEENSRAAQIQARMAEQIEFDKLLAELFNSFINPSFDRMDSDIENLQRRVCGYFELDRSTIWQFQDAELKDAFISHLYHRPVSDADLASAPPIPLAQGGQNATDPGVISGFACIETAKHFPWSTEHFRNKRTVIISRFDDLPEEASIDKEFIRHYGARSNVMIPLVEGDSVMGVMTFVSLFEERKWPEFVVNRLQHIARIVANALTHKKYHQKLQDSEMRLTLAAESANVGLWDLDLAEGAIWATDKVRELFGIAPEQPLTRETLLSHIHPEDVEKARQSFRDSAQTGTPARVDFRVCRPDGQLIWLTCRGMPHARETGERHRIMGVAIDITERKHLEAELEAKIHEITMLKKRVEMENICLKEEHQLLNNRFDIVGQSNAIRKIFQQIAQVAPTDSHVLITGETGTGKELVAKAIHAESKRRDRILVKVNCATLPASLIEGELFGREKGAYTGALTRLIGRFEMADGGTILLDEIGELSVELQSKLLRVLQEGEFERLGGPKTIRVNVRIIAATNRNLTDAVRDGSFRKDLYYRLSVFPIEVPPLRARREDIPLLVWAFIDQFSQRMGKNVKSISNRTMEMLKRYSWPGNVRELRNIIEHAMILNGGDQLAVQLRELLEDSDEPILAFHAAEHNLLLEALRKTDWRIKGPNAAAALLGLKPSTLYTKMKKLGIPTRRHRDGKPS